MTRNGLCGGWERLNGWLDMFAVPMAALAIGLAAGDRLAFLALRLVIDESEAAYVVATLPGGTAARLLFGGVFLAIGWRFR